MSAPVDTNKDGPPMTTVWLLLGMYQGRLQLTADEVARDFFGHLSTQKLIREIDAGEIDLPLLRNEGSTKAARYVDIRDLAEYLDKWRAEAVRVNSAIHGRLPSNRRRVRPM